MRGMKKLPPRNSWREKPWRGSPSTDAIGTGSVTTGMWQAWQLFSCRYALCRHSRYGTCSGSSPTTLPPGPSEWVKSVWHVAHISDDWMWAAAVGVKAEAERIIRALPGVDVERAEDRGAGPAATVVSTTKPAVKLSGVPSFSGVIWWHTVHDTPSAASSASGVCAMAMGRWAKTSPFPPAIFAA